MRRYICAIVAATVSSPPSHRNHADLFVLCQRPAFDRAVDDRRCQMFIGVLFLFGDEAAQESQHAAQRPLHLFQTARMEDVPFPLEEFLEHFLGKTHQPHENAHREHPGEIPGHVDFALFAHFLDHFDHDFANARFDLAGDPRRRQEREQEHPVFRMLGRIDGERNRRERLADQPLEFGGALVREMIVVTIDPVDVLVMGDDPVAHRAAAGDRAKAAARRRVEQQARNVGAGQPADMFVRIDLIVGHAAHRPRQIDDAVLRHMRRRIGIIDADGIEGACFGHGTLPIPPATCHRRPRRAISRPIAPMITVFSLGASPPERSSARG